MREVHGVVARLLGNPGKEQSVRITDRPQDIALIHTATEAAVIDAEEARFLAKQLMLAARRLDQRMKK